MTPEARAAKRARHRANVAAREEGVPPAPPTADKRPQKITGAYDAGHLWSTKDNPDPGLLAQPDEAWQHLAALFAWSKRRAPLPVAIRVHPAYPVRRPMWMQREAA